LYLIENPDSIIKDAPTALDETDFKKFKSQSQSQQKSNRALSAGGQNTTAVTAAKSNTRITFSVYDSINL
jgi:hypothetical protein